MTISILKLEAGQKIARPFNRASSHTELAEMLLHWLAMDSNDVGSGRYKVGLATARVAIDGLYNAADTWVYARRFGIDVDHINSETPVLVSGTTKFFAFTEE